MYTPDSMANLEDFEAGHQLPGELPQAAEMTVREKALRDTFVSEFLVDYDQVAAAMRCGFNRQFAQEYAQKFMEEPYVQQQINRVRFSPMDDNELEKYDKARVRSQLMAEAHYKGPGSSHAARVAALGRLQAMLGMEAPKKVDATVNHRGGVMAVPGIAKLDDWEQEASASQDALVEHARDQQD